MDEKLMSALRKKAKGYTYSEVQEEFSVDESGELSLIKKKVLKKYCPPDAVALKAYLELSGVRSYDEYTEDELLKERDKLLRELGEKYCVDFGNVVEDAADGALTEGDEPETNAERNASAKETESKTTMAKTASKTPAAKAKSKTTTAKAKTTKATAATKKSTAKKSAATKKTATSENTAAKKSTASKKTATTKKTATAKVISEVADEE